ncbi:MAG TPA: cupin domain-containing protein [Micropepsaceae bacterium]|jgi:quercetin dioxygenase-like cupin family protein|nr:cupin domain-containing protein [Micropepsaceae bacterium]
MPKINDAHRAAGPIREPLMRFGLAALFVSLAPVPGAAAAQTPQREAPMQAFREAIPNIPGKSLVGFVVNYAPGGKTPPHHHAPSAFVTGYVLSGAIRSQVDGGEVKIYRAGESWSEKPGAHHTISENASTTEPAKLLAIFVVDSNDKELTTIEGH